MLAVWIDSDCTYGQKPKWVDGRGAVVRRGCEAYVSGMP